MKVVLPNLSWEGLCIFPAFFLFISIRKSFQWFRVSLRKFLAHGPDGLQYRGLHLVRPSSRVCDDFGIANHFKRSKSDGVPFWTHKWLVILMTLLLVYIYIYQHLFIVWTQYSTIKVMASLRQRAIATRKRYSQQSGGGVTCHVPSPTLNLISHFFVEATVWAK